MTLKLEQLSCRFKEHQFEYSLELEAGEIMAVLGASGAGKSTLIELIAGFCKAEAGRVSWNNLDFSQNNPAQRPVTTLFQQHNLFNHLSLRQNIAFGLHPSGKLNAHQTQLLLQIAQELGITAQLDSLVNQVSGGQQQRAALARCLLRKHPVLLLDEPFSALDPVTRAESLSLVREYAKRLQLCVIMVSHSLSDAMHVADRILFIEQGEIQQNSSASDFITEPASKNIADYIQASSLAAVNKL
ncbi:thiamine ABC transporter ATP-binding protein [Alginatibacterium sediminis]|uniref:Thiamine ABC transporter ATP-binding protein n=1 Tax=Alginatibacterium sediminis TaxID=2164068 RepID=A0A420ECX4_9ALTE|nr:thiamine ABC transporter ATP-binding protein [Alginatibacterium sediminis]RKF18504.1 thiamine ABC transporter ATP-binding protein [Alginatibacterium sediminis]